MSRDTNSLRFKSALLFAKGMNSVINLVSSGRGSNLSGEKALLIDPEMVAHFKNVDPKKVIFITGTNGKSSSTNLVTHILRYNGKNVVSNLEGANLLAGLATSLAKESDMNGRLDADYFVFETDERYLPLIYAQLPAANVMIMNLQKDQVQRNGDPAFIMEKVASVMKPEVRLFLNNDEPRSKSFEKYSENTVYFGTEQNRESFMKDETYPTEACPVCDHKVDFDYYNTDGIGRFHCSNCGFSSCPEATYTVSDIDYDNRKFKLNGVEGEMPYDLPFMLYNYAGAAALCAEVAGLTEEQILAALPSFQNIGGRFETFDYHGKTVKYMRIKQENPDTLQNAINVIAGDQERKMVCLGLYPIHDFTPGYTNTFYTFDCDWSRLADSDVERYYCFSPAVCYDTANRLIYEDVPAEKITVEETDDIDQIFAQIDQAETDDIYLITWLDTFNKMKKFVEAEQKNQQATEKAEGAQA